MIAPDVLLKPRQIRREIERKQMRIETLRRFAEHLTSPLREVRVKSRPSSRKPRTRKSSCLCWKRSWSRRWQLPPS